MGEKAAHTPAPTDAKPLTDAEFRAVYEAQLAYVWHSLARLGVPARDVEDLCHDVFVAFYRGRADFDSARPVKPWLFGIAFRIASDYRRRASTARVDLRAPAPEVADAAPAADERVAAREGAALVDEALGTLDLDRRAVFVMHDIDGHAMPDIARVLGVPLNTCYSRLRLGREQFTNAVRRLRRGPFETGDGR